MAEQGKLVHFVVKYDTESERFTIDDELTEHMKGRVWGRVIGDWELTGDNVDLIDMVADRLDQQLALSPGLPGKIKEFMDLWFQGPRTEAENKRYFDLATDLRSI